MHHLVVLLLNALDGFILVSRSKSISVRDRFLHDLVLLVLSIEFHLKVVLLGVDLIGQFGLLDDIPHEFEVVQEEHELPHQPNHRQKERSSRESHHCRAVGQFELGSRVEFVIVEENAHFKHDVAKLDEDIGPIRKTRFGRFIEEVIGENKEVAANHGDDLHLQQSEN